ncbi:hypothetical protein ES705_46515 [subsurface metagenome]
MKIEVTSKSGISFTVELTEDERENIKTDLENNLTEMKSATDNEDTDAFLEEIKKIL